MRTVGTGLRAPGASLEEEPWSKSGTLEEGGGDQHDGAKRTAASAATLAVATCCEGKAVARIRTSRAEMCSLAQLRTEGLNHQHLGCKLRRTCRDWERFRQDRKRRPGGNDP